MKRAFFFHQWWHDIIWQETSFAINKSKKEENEWYCYICLSSSQDQNKMQIC
jgi:hypothetical protein